MMEKKSKQIASKKCIFSKQNLEDLEIENTYPFNGEFQMYFPCLLSKKAKTIEDAKNTVGNYGQNIK